jgi:antitoxin MazE
MTICDDSGMVLMATPIRTRLVRMGNSQGVRIPKALIEQYQLTGEVELLAEDDHLVIRSAHHPREGWDEAFRLMAERGDDKLLDEEFLAPSEWDLTEWEW